MKEIFMGCRFKSTEKTKEIASKIKECCKDLPTGVLP
jgi:hypothetical protein